MAANRIERVSISRPAPTHAQAELEFEVHRVRCVLKHERHYLLVQHHSPRSHNVGKWALPGGRLKACEKPKAGLRRELDEELQLRVRHLLKLGDWRHRNEYHRIFGCEIGHPVDWFNAEEIVTTSWFTYAEVKMLARASRLHRGFELAAIRELKARLSR